MLAHLKRHRICVAALLLLLLHCGPWLEVGKELKEEVVVIEAVDKEEEDVDDGENAAGVERAVLPAASGHEEGRHVDLRPEGGKQEDLHCTDEQLWLIFPCVVELPPVLQVHNVLGRQVEGEEDSEEGAGEAKEEEDGGVEDQPDILVRKSQLVARAILSTAHELLCSVMAAEELVLACASTPVDLPSPRPVSSRSSLQRRSLPA